METAKEADIPVFGMDGGPTRCSSPTSPATATRWRARPRLRREPHRRRRRCRDVVFDAFPPVQVRGVIADAIFKNCPTSRSSTGSCPTLRTAASPSRAKMEAILAANPNQGSIGAIWAAWDQPALGALQAIEAAGRNGRRDRHRRHRRQPAGAGSDRQGREFRSLDRARLQGHRHNGRRHGQTVPGRRKNQAERDLCAHDADHRGQCQGGCAKARRRRAARARQDHR